MCGHQNSGSPMIAIPTGVRVWLAAGHTDMRRYAERQIMRSRQWKGKRRCGFSVAPLCIIL